MLVAAPALAEEKVAVQVQVVHAMTSGSTVEPPTLKAMQDAMAKKVKYGSLKQLSVEKIELEKKKVRTLKLANGKEATLELEGLKDDVATLRLKVPPADTTYNLGKKGSLYVHAGPHDGGDLWLVLSPAK